MTDELRHKMINEGQVILTPFQKFNYYLVIWALGVINLLMLALAWNQEMYSANGKGMTNNQLLICTGLNILLMFALYNSLKNRLKFTKLTTVLTESQIKEIVYNVGRKKELLLKHKTSYFIQTDTVSFFMGPVNRISILIDNGDFYINSFAIDGTIGFFRYDGTKKLFLSEVEDKNEEMIYKNEIYGKYASR